MADMKKSLVLGWSNRCIAQSEISGRSKRLQAVHETLWAPYHENLQTQFTFDPDKSQQLQGDTPIKFITQYTNFKSVVLRPL